MRDESIDWSSVFKTLASENRRSLMQYLVGTNGRSSVDEIVAELEGRNGPGLDEADESHPASNLRVRLLHADLPALADADLIRWDRDASEVETTAVASRIPAEFITPRVMMSAEQASQREASD
jgi:DNA-binding transcriptional ArsR family regulator